MHAANTCSTHHDWQQPVDLTAICNEIECRMAQWSILFSTLAPALNGAMEQQQLNNTKSSIQQLETMTTTMTITTTQPGFEDNI